MIEVWIHTYDGELQPVDEFWIGRNVYRSFEDVGDIPGGTPGVIVEPNEATYTGYVRVRWTTSRYDGPVTNAQKRLVL